MNVFNSAIGLCFSEGLTCQWGVHDKIPIEVLAGRARAWNSFPKWRVCDRERKIFADPLRPGVSRFSSFYPLLVLKRLDC